MPFPVPRLDDRSFDDLVSELLGRAASHVPEWRPVPGDPGSALVDLVAWMGEAVIYRLNLLPERQRRAFLNLLHLPLRPARPARGVLCVDPPLLQPEPRTFPPGTQFKAGKVELVSDGEVTPLPLLAVPMIKEEAPDLAAKGQSEGRRYFRPRSLVPGKDLLQPGAGVDGYLYLCCAAPPKGVVADIRELVAGRTLALGLVPDRGSDADQPVGARAQRSVVVEIAQGTAQADQGDPAERQATRWWPLDLVGDSSDGGQAAGVLRLALPRDVERFTPAAQEDPEFTGVGVSPPEAPAGLTEVVFWLRLHVKDDADFALGWLGVNAVEVTAQKAEPPRVVGIGTGEGDQQLWLQATDVDPESLGLEVDEGGAWRAWSLVDNFGGLGASARVAVLDPESGILRFGDGVSGMRPPRNARIRAAFRCGGGAAGNLAPGSVKELVNGPRDFKLRQEWALEGGADAESVATAERRIPEFLQNRDRAVTADDYRALVLSHPAAVVARAEVRPGLLPVPGPAARRRDVPGVVSVFVMPPGVPAPASPPRPTKGLLADVFEWLKDRKLIGTELYVLSPEFVPVAAALSVVVEDPRAESSVLLEVEKAVTRFLFALQPGGSGAGWPFGRTVDAEEIRAQGDRVAGVLKVHAVRLWRGTPQGWLEVGGGQLTLEDWQLPDLQAVSAQPGDGTPVPPAPLTSPDTGGDIAPAPIPPDLC